MKAYMTPFAVRDGSIWSTTDYDNIVRCQVIDALATNAGERLMYPDYGCNIQSMLFNPVDALERSDTASYVKQRLQQLVPRAFVESVTIERAEDVGPSAVYIHVRFKASRYAPGREVTVTTNVGTND